MCLCKSILATGWTFYNVVFHIVQLLSVGITSIILTFLYRSILTESQDNMTEISAYASRFNLYIKNRTLMTIPIKKITM